MKLSYNNLKTNLLDIKFSKTDDVFLWGDGNSYPQIIDSLLNVSVTAKRCVDMVAKAIYGKSFGPQGRVIVNKTGQSLNEVLRIASREYSKYKNTFIHIGYDGDLNIKSIKVIPATMVRIGKADDLGYSGKFIIYDKWDKRIKKEEYRIYDRYNPNKDVILSQIEAAGGIQKYKGQILHIQEDTNSVYSLSDLHPVLSEALLEHNSQTFRSRGAEKGFLNTKLMTVQPFASEEERREFKRTLKSLQGSDNSGDILLLEASQMTDNLGDEVRLDDLSSSYNDKLFEYSDNLSKENICIAYGVPVSLLTTKDNSLFGGSGEMIVQMQKQLYMSREEERDQITEALNNLMYKFQEPIKEELEIINPYE